MGSRFNITKHNGRLIGVGIDIFRVQKVFATIKRGNEKAFKKIFTENELRRAKKSGRRVEHLASCFAGKEAVFKALSLSWADGVKWVEIEIVRNETGSPSVTLTGKACEVAINKGISKILLSLSHETDYVVAVCIALKD